MIAKDPITIAIMNLVDGFGAMTGWNVSQVIDALNRIYYL